MEHISLDKNTLTIKYADKYYSIVFDENTFKDCRIINNENIVDMLSNTDFTKYSLNSITDTLMITINYVEQTRYMTINDSCIIECLLVDNSEQLFVREKIEKLEQQITELKLENERIRSEFNSIEMRILRNQNKIRLNAEYYKGLSVDEINFCIVSFFRKTSIDEYNQYISLDIEQLNILINKKIKDKNKKANNNILVRRFECAEELFDYIDIDIKLIYNLCSSSNITSEKINTRIFGSVVHSISGYYLIENKLCKLILAYNGGCVGAHLGKHYENPIIIAYFEIVD